MYYITFPPICQYQNKNPPKRIFVNLINSTVGTENGDVVKPFRIFKSVPFGNSSAVAELLERITIEKCAIRNVLYAFRQSNVDQSLAFSKHTLIDILNAFTDDDVPQVAAIVKALAFYRFHAARNHHIDKLR